MRITRDIRTLYRMALSPIQGGTHAERLESFYQAQARDYDHFRDRLLHGRDQLFDSVPAFEGGVWIDLGAGTGANAFRLGDRLSRFDRVYLVDLSPSLLDVARRRAEANGWSNTVVVEADACTFVPPEGQADLLTFSYSLTMIPGWHQALLHARSILAPNGIIGVVDFTVARKHPDPGRRKQWWLARQFWRTWFERDNVFLTAEHPQLLQALFEPLHFSEHLASVPYLFGLKASYYLFIGRPRDVCGAAIREDPAYCQGARRPKPSGPHAH